MVKTITEFLSHPFWTFSLGVLITIIISTIYYLLQRHRKTLTYNVNSSNRVINKDIESKGNLQILFNNKQVRNSYLIEISINNSGNIPVKSEDFVENLRFDFGEDSEVLNVEVLKQNPYNLNIKFELEGNFLSIKPILLNPKDFVKFKVLVSEYNGYLTVNYRIVGVTELTKYVEKNKFNIINNISNIIISILMIVTLILMVTYGIKLRYIIYFVSLQLIYTSLLNIRFYLRKRKVSD